LDIVISTLISVRRDMMKKTLLVSSVILLVSLGSVFASGSQEEGPYGGFTGPGVSEKIELTGRVQFPGYGHPELVAGGETYEIMVPFFLLDEVDLEEGETVTVEGFLVPGPRWGEDGDEKHLAVTEAVVDGETYELGFGRGYMRGRTADNRFGGCGYGPRGPRGGWGRMGPGGGGPRVGRW
jgi:hypothetical protein